MVYTGRTEQKQGKTSTITTIIATVKNNSGNSNKEAVFEMIPRREIVLTGGRFYLTGIDYVC